MTPDKFSLARDVGKLLSRQEPKPSRAKRIGEQGAVIDSQTLKLLRRKEDLENKKNEFKKNIQKIFKKKSEAQDQEMMEGCVSSYMSKAKYKAKYKDKKAELKKIKGDLLQAKAEKREVEYQLEQLQKKFSALQIHE